MDDLTFDTIARSVVRAHSRRAALRLLAGTVITGVLESRSAPEALLAKGHRRHRKHKNKKKGCSPLQTRCRDHCCPQGFFCCGGWCVSPVALIDHVPVFSQCCHDHIIDLEQVCCPNGVGCGLDEECCGDGCCPPGELCCGDGSSVRCCPDRTTCCGNKCCRAGLVCRDGECVAMCGGSACPADWPCCQGQCYVPCSDGQEIDPVTCLCQACAPDEELCGGECCGPCGCEQGVCTNNWYVCGDECCYQGYTCCTSPVTHCCSPSKPICTDSGGCQYN